MKTEQANCSIQKNVLFILKTCGFDGDRNYQAARMALSLAMDAVPHVLFSDKALVLAVNNSPIEKPLTDFYEQEHYLQDLGIPCYVVLEELRDQGHAIETVRKGFVKISSKEYETLLKKVDFVITA